MSSISRRRWLVEMAALAALPRVWSALAPGEELVDFADEGDFKPEVSPTNPRVKCLDLRKLTSAITPADEFFVFHQTTVPSIDLPSWTLEVAGFVERAATFTLAELLAGFGPRREIEFTLECSGNLPQPEIMNGQVSHARWAGVSLAALLHHCAIKAEAREVVFFGADQVRDPGGIALGPHARSVFVADALDPDAILATHMNGQPLPPEHGFPLRLILPGWYGMAQIKWLNRIEVLDRRYEGAHMARNYHTLQSVAVPGHESILLETSISRTRLKSVVARVTRTRRGGAWSHHVAGAAWGGSSPVARVELRVDHGAWREARIDERRGDHGWVLWSCDWNDASPGRHTLTSRAIDVQGRIQPSAEEWARTIKSARENNAQWERSIEIRA